MKNACVVLSRGYMDIESYTMLIQRNRYIKQHDTFRQRMGLIRFLAILVDGFLKKIQTIKSTRFNPEFYGVKY